MHSPYYNLFDPHYTKVFNKIKSLGHNVGLHFDSHYYGIDNENQLNEYIELDKIYFETVLNVKIDVYSFHNTTSFTQRCLARTYGGLINVYSSFFREHFDYCGDSLGYWRFDVLGEMLENPNVRHLQVLTHDANWSEEVLSPRKRLTKAFFDQAARLDREQVEGLHRKGMKSIDDEDE